MRMKGCLLDLTGALIVGSRSGQFEAGLKLAEKGIWQSMSGLDKNMVHEYGVYRVAMLMGANGDPIGQVLLGKPTTKSSLDRQDEAEVEMILSLVGTMIENGNRSAGKRSTKW